MIHHIPELKKEMGDSLLILAHYYQHQSVQDIADIIGDSYKLSVEAQKADVSNIVFCGVRFMAETAKILAKPEQHVFLPVLQAECEMAKMAESSVLHHYYETIPLLRDNFVPVVYVNTTADIKAFAGKYEGVTCTSSNAKNIISTIIKKNKGVFFIPDKNLGMNVARSLNIAENSIAFIEEVHDKTQFCLWDGYCPVHHYMSVENVENARENHPKASVIVHPECPPEVVERADFAGSTAQLLHYIKETPSGSSVVIGTEYNFVESIKNRFPDKMIFHLKPAKCLDMHAINLAEVERTLNHIKTGSTENEIHLDHHIINDAEKPIKKMIEITEAQSNDKGGTS